MKKQKVRVYAEGSENLRRMRRKARKFFGIEMADWKKLSNLQMRELVLGYMARTK